MSAEGFSGIPRLLRQFLGIALLKKGPQDLPASPGALAFTVACFAGVSLAFGSLLPPQPAPPLLLNGFEILFMLLWLAAVLKIAGKPERFLQTATAVFGFRLVLSPLLALSRWIVLAVKEQSLWQLPVSLLVLALLIWALVVGVRILQAATEWPVVACVALTFAQELLLLGLMLMFFPEIVPSLTGEAAAAQPA